MVNKHRTEICTTWSKVCGQSNITSTCHSWSLINRPALKLIPKVFNGVEVRAWYRTIKSFNSKCDKPFVPGLTFCSVMPRHRKWHCPNCYHSIRSTLLSKISLYAVAVRFDTIENQLKTIFPHAQLNWWTHMSTYIWPYSVTKWNCVFLYSTQF